jgi:two-component system cell cycle sensor histidine kinase/response regulator CckA
VIVGDEAAGKTADDDVDAYRLLFESSPRPIFVFDRNTLAILAVNDAACTQYGWTRDELVTMTIRDLRSAEELPHMDRHLAQRRAAGVFHGSSQGMRHMTKAGRVLDVDVETSRLVFQGREAALAIVTDVTGAALAERRFRLLVEHSADGIAVVSEKNVVEYMSPGAERILGLGPGDLVGSPAGVLTHPDDIRGWIPPLPGKTSVVVTRSKHRDGKWRWLECVTTNLTQDVAVRAYVTNFRDVTERIATEHAARDAQRRLEYVMSATTAVTYTARAFGDFGASFVSSNVIDLVGYDARAFVDEAGFWLNHIHPNDRMAVHEGQRALFASGEHSFQYRFRHADGRYRSLQDAARLVRDENGDPKEIVGYWIDVTDRSQADEALRRSEAKFRTLIERSPTAIFVQRAGRFVYVNGALLAMLGYESASDLVGKVVLDSIHVDDRALVRGQQHRTANEGDSPVREARMLRRDGTEIVVEAEGVLLDFDGETSNVVLARDVTERRRMLARVATADRMLSIGTLAAGVAHEINTPLAYVISNLALLANELPAVLSTMASDESKRARLSAQDIEVILRDAQEGAARVSGIVRHLRVLSRADDEAHGSVDAVAVLRSSIKMAENEIRHRARVVLELDRRLPRVHANESRLGQVFLNLLVNAAQAIPVGHVEENEISVRARASAGGNHVTIEVEDTGAGIAPSVIGRIFDPFFTTKAVGDGTGLGLAICQQIVKSAGGEISVTSELGKGACFRVTLAAALHDEPAADSSAPPPRLQSTPARVLMVDDEPALGRSTRLLLAPEHEVVNVTRARDALERLARGERFDVILCDLMMPEMSGIEFHRQLARTTPEYVGRVVFVTGGAFTEEARAFLAELACPCVEKPFTENALRGAIEKISARPANEGSS